VFVRKEDRAEIHLLPLVKRSGRPPAPDSSAVTRQCPRHGTVTFHLYRQRGKMGYKCKRCVGEAVTRRHRKVRAILLTEAGGRCAVCGYDRCATNLHFHHVDRAEKAFNVNMSSGKSLSAYRTEARKCVLVCANCHGEIEAGEIASPSAGVKFAGPGTEWLASELTLAPRQ
jgi:hypothetical protein